MLLPTLILALAACKGAEEEFPYRAFNADDQSLAVCVGDGAGCEPVAELALLSTNGSTEIGVAVVDPASGPVGTVHRFEVTVDAEWIESVALVQVRLDGDRGTQTWDLRQDSADHGNWVIEIESLGDAVEQRQDDATILLWELLPEEVEATTTEET